MDRAIERALRGCGEAEAEAAPGLLDEVRRRMFGIAAPEVWLGRYRLVGRIGAGGGGIVVRAEDPQLAREVAIKLVRSDSRNDPDAARRLQREARALARLSHPDIVTIYDVGRVDARRDVALERIVGAPVDGSVYLVMQWLDGGDLSQWLAATPRPWAEIVDAFVAAGRGLAAAHAAGLLHRDFKPANVLLDRQARPRVADFGLTRVDQDTTVAQHGHDTLLDGPTRTDLVVGTPLYMAPEQHLGEHVDARTDQYAFCFALHEALFGRLRFAGIDELVRAKLEGVPAGTARGVPRALGQVLARGLARDPAARWPTMDALLSALALARRPRTSRRIAVITGGLVVLALAAGSRSPAEPCTADDPGWASVWGEPRLQIAEVFARADGFGRDTFATVDERMSALGRRWAQTRDHVCGLPDPEPGIACLEAQRTRASEIVDAWHAAGRDGVAEAARELGALDEPEACAEARRATPVRDARRGRVAQRVDALVAAGRMIEAAELAETMLGDDADATPAERLSAATAFDRAGRYADAERELTTAVHDAEADGDTVGVVHAAARLITVVGSELDRPEDGERWGRHAWAALARVDDDGTLGAEVHEHLGRLAMGRGQWQRALDHFEQSSRMLVAARPDDELRRATLLASAAGARINLGSYVDAIAGFDEVIEIQRALLGEGHPALAMTRHNLSIALSLTGDQRRAREECTRALDAWTIAYGGKHPDLALGEQTLASICRNAGDLGCAIDHAERAVALRTELAGPDHPDTLTAEIALATAYDSADRFDEAGRILQHVVAAHEQDPTLTPHGGIAWMNLGDVQRRSGQLTAARTSFARARELLLVSHGPRHLAIGMLLLNLGALAREQGRFDDALASIDEAEAVLIAAMGPKHGLVASARRDRETVLAARAERPQEATL